MATSQSTVTTSKSTGKFHQKDQKSQPEDGQQLTKDQLKRKSGETTQAEKLLVASCLSLYQKTYTIADLRLMMHTDGMKEYGVKVVPAYPPYKPIYTYYSREPLKPKEYLYILYIPPSDINAPRPTMLSDTQPNPPGHFAAVKKMATLRATKHYCQHCDLAYNDLEQHLCRHAICPQCLSQARAKCSRVFGAAMITCEECHRQFYNQQCMDNHLEKKPLTAKGKSLVNRKKRKLAEVDEIEVKLSTCNKIWICQECKQLARGNREDSLDHKGCGEEKCPSCRQVVPVGGHEQCYIMPIPGGNRGDDGPMMTLEQEYLEITGGLGDETAKEPADDDDDDEFEKGSNVVMIYADFESVQSNDYVDNKGKVVGKLHEPNLCVTHKVCDYCLEAIHVPLGWSPTHKCIRCNKGKHTAEQLFEGRKTVVDFIKWLMDDKMNKNAYVMFHNGAKYDFAFIIQWMQHAGIKHTLVPNGHSIMIMKTVRLRIKFVDTLLYLPMSLDKVQQAFNLPLGPKMRFPHYANTWANWDMEEKWEKELDKTSSIYGVGELPPIKLYALDRMSKDEEGRFRKEYHDAAQEMRRTNGVWNLHDELKRYCRHDVSLLRAGFGQYRQKIIDLTKFDPLTQASTLASTSTGIIRTLMDQPEPGEQSKQIALVPVGGYVKTKSSSRVCEQWLLTEEMQAREKDPRFSIDREVKFSELCPWVENPRKYVLDGVSTTIPRRIYEYDGAY
ncbi:MAG: hypothetical protein GY696_29305 [Gammaproteobacteria bacterium]|nr:hypothetical protein [Gammaproteobacteria bacterium]